jgi:hypothetical protein
MGTYTEIDGQAFETFLQGMGFTRTVFCNEVVYERHHDKEPKLVIKCYTSISSNATVARGRGADAIRVVAVLNGKVAGQDRCYPIYKGARVFRTTSQESVQQRTLERCREAYMRCNVWLREKREKEEAFAFGANQVERLGVGRIGPGHAILLRPR